MTESQEMQAAIEAVLFVSGEPVSEKRILDMFDEDEANQAREAMEAVLERYRGDRAERGMMLDEAAGGFRLVTRPAVHDWLRRFFESSSNRRLSMGALETLAIVAYRQPVTGPEIQELRGVNSAGVLKTLLERRLVRIAGRKEVVGKPFLYCTTREFLIHFGLPSLKDLPPLEEFEEALAAEAGQEGLAGVDEEEELLRSAAEIEEAEADRQAKQDEIEEELAVEAAEAEQEANEEPEDGEGQEPPSSAPQSSAPQSSYLASEEAESTEAELEHEVDSEDEETESP